MNELTVFENPAFGRVRTTTIKGEPWFVASDVCKCLELSNTTVALDRLDADERSKLNLGRQGETNLVNEPGLYSLVLSSRKQEAKAFKRWITHEVIPSIRKHGAYITPKTLDEMISSPDFGIRLLSELKAEREKNRELEGKIETDKPKVLFADAVSASKSSILVGELAKLLKQNGVDIGQNRLFEFLRGKGYLIKRKGTDYNMPTQYSMERGLFEIKETVINNPDGSVRTNKTPKVTGKGQQYFVALFLGGEA